VPAGTALVVRDAAPLSLFGPAGAAEALAHVETYATTLREFVERHPEVGNSDTTPVGEQVCERCGGHYYPRGGRQRFCSAECRLKSGKSRPPNWLKPTGGPPLPARPCAFWGCGRMFEPKHDRHAFCSPACRYGARRRDQSSRYGRGHRNRRAALEPIVALGRTPCARRRELILPSGLGLGSGRGRHLSRPVTRRLQSRRADAQSSELGGDIERDEDVARVVRDRP
jgi:hypothetical protein